MTNARAVLRWQNHMLFNLYLYTRLIALPASRIHMVRIMHRKAKAVIASAARYSVLGQTECWILTDVAARFAEIDPRTVRASGEEQLSAGGTTKRTRICIETRLACTTAIMHTAYTCPNALRSRTCRSLKFQLRRRAWQTVHKDIHDTGVPNEASTQANITILV